MEAHVTGAIAGHPRRAIVGGLLLWLTGMVVGIAVFSVPQLRSAPAIPFLTSNPFITAPILVIWIVLSRSLARRFLVDAPKPAAEGLRIGLLFFAVNAVLDFVVVVGLMKNGINFYAYLGPWLGYATLVIMPWMVGRAASP